MKKTSRKGYKLPKIKEEENECDSSINEDIITDINEEYEKE